MAKHRFDVTELRGDGRPPCPWCGADELLSHARSAVAVLACAADNSTVAAVVRVGEGVTADGAAEFDRAAFAATEIASGRARIPALAAVHIVRCEIHASRGA